MKLIAIFDKKPKWFDIKPARKTRKLGGLSSVAIIRESLSVTGHCFINFEVEILLPQLGQHLPFGVGPAHPGYLEVCLIHGTHSYRIFFAYLEGWPPPVWLWTQDGYPDFVKEVKYQKSGDNDAR